MTEKCNTEYEIELDPGDADETYERAWKTGTIHIEPKYDDFGFGQVWKQKIQNLLDGIPVDDSSTNSAVNSHESGPTTVSTTGDEGLAIIEQITQHLKTLYSAESDKSDAKLVNEAMEAVDRYRTRKAEESQIKILEESTTKGPEQI